MGDADHALLYKLLAQVSPPDKAANMLLLHQVGSVKIGEVVRYTVTYTPSHDRILPSPEVLHLRIRNTSAIALRAAFVHGPYTLNVAAYPAHYDPNRKFENPRRYGVPEFEPTLKAGGTWTCQLQVPDDIRQSAGLGASRGNFSAEDDTEGERSASWVVEVTSQVVFSGSASVGYEVLLARDEKSFSLGATPVIGGQAHVPQPGKVGDFQQSAGAKDGHHPAQTRGLFSRAVTLKVEDTASLWNTPRLPGWDDDWGHDHELNAPGQDAATKSVTHPTGDQGETAAAQNQGEGAKAEKKQKVHLVVLTHGLHSNLGADMLYIKESIDATVRQAKLDAKERRAKERAERDAKRKEQLGTQEQGSDQEAAEQAEEEDEHQDEEVIVRGFSGNATRTERGIKFLGKRMARFILSMTYPDQPFLPALKSPSGSFASAFHTTDAAKEGKPAHQHSSVHHHSKPECSRLFQVTSISFIGHSLGGLVQTYAIAYVQKHSPHFFDHIRPVNFITLASPLLGLSNENPLYVKFALDFGLVGRTGQDLGLTWRAPTLARSGWGAVVSRLGESAQKKVMGEVQPESKPLLRILPTGPAHAALKKFRNRTVYGNVVNDGIVPLRTSILLFLDWQGLGRVEKARREAGLVESVIGFGWAELTGAGMTSPRRGRWNPESEDTPAISNVSSDPDTEHEDSREVPQPASNAVVEDARRSITLSNSYKGDGHAQNSQTEGPMSSFWNFFKTSDQKSPGLKSPSGKTSPPPPSPKHHKIYQRSQTLKLDDATADSASSSRSKVTAGHELSDDHESGVSAPPRTSFFESAGDLLNPKLPTTEFLLDPARRPRAIFHDRVYHPSDIPAPPLKKRAAGSRCASVGRKASSSSLKPQSAEGSGSSSPLHSPKPGAAHENSDLSTKDYDDAKHTNPDRGPDEVIDSSNMRVEEKIARAYHKDLSWRKVLVKLEPDAHNNIIVRRMFANAHGWPVVKHLVDAHFSDSAATRMRDENEKSTERAKAMDEPPDSTGTEIKKDDPETREANGETAPDDRTGKEPETRPPWLSHARTPSEALEARDSVAPLPEQALSSCSPGSEHLKHPEATHNPTAPSPELRPRVDRLDSVTWSDRDWSDSADDSDGDLDLAIPGHGGGPGSQEEKRKETDRDGSSSPIWNWTEKIVGKGSSSHAGKGAKEGSSEPSGSSHAGRGAKEESPGPEVGGGTSVSGAAEGR